MSDVRPVIADAEREAFSRAWMNLRAALQALSPSLVAAMEDDSISTGPTAGPSPSVGSDGWTDRTEAASEQPARQPEGEPAPVGSTPTPRGDSQPADAVASGTKDLLVSDPAARAVAAAYALRKAGKPVSVRAACKAAKVDRKNLATNHPETIELIEKLAEPDRTPPRSASDRRTGNLDGWDDPEED